MSLSGWAGLVVPVGLSGGSISAVVAWSESDWVGLVEPVWIFLIPILRLALESFIAQDSSGGIGRPLCV